MNERLFHEHQCKAARNVSNILYAEVKKHEANRHLIYIFDDDFIAAAQERVAWQSFFMLVVLKITKNWWVKNT